MACCLETAILNALRGLDCTPIRSENHFLLERKCTDCIPYVVVRVSDTAGLRTSSAVQRVSSIEINAYFSANAEQTAFAYRKIVDDWIDTPGCVDLGDCGCFCVQGSGASRVAMSQGDLIRYSRTISGFYQPSEAGSLSASVSG